MQSTTSKPRHLALLTVCIMLATIMQALDTTIANVALPYMQGSLSATADQINWVLTSYIVAAAIATPVTGFLATVSKGAVLAVLLRYFQIVGGYRLESVTFAMTLIAIASILAGNLLALLQRDLKRILAYSSIAHFGYLLIAFLAGGAFAVESVNFYLAAYVATTLAAFGVITVVASDVPRGGDLDEGDLEIYRGLLWRRPALAGLLALTGALVLASAAHAGGPAAPKRDVVGACLEDHARGQELQLGEKLLEAREAFLRCSASLCPGEIQRDCLGYLERVRTQIPSVVLRVSSWSSFRTEAVCC